MKLSDIERRLRYEGFEMIAGVDEAGRGPLAGPVVTAAVILPPDCRLRHVKDSKQLRRPVQRLEAYQEIVENALSFALSASSPKVIDRINILQATMIAMRRAVERLRVSAQYVLIDGNRTPDSMPCRCEAIVRGDAIIQSIAAASILAKVTRDRLMIGLDALYPQYGFAKHKGYGTLEHMKAIGEFGPTPHHRFSFSPVRQMGLFAG